ncbi:MAG: ASCH domain-containing protein [Gemmataceae bacterium]
MPELRYALSLKQPWATLLVHGLKCIEIRSWATGLRQDVLIHAARIPDSRPEAWKLVPDDLQDLARLVGGVVGSAELTGCIPYRTPAAFAADRALHLNDPSWFRPRLHGFVFARTAQRPFSRCPGNVRFFRVTEESPDDRHIVRAPDARPARQRARRHGG